KTQIRELLTNGLILLTPEELGGADWIEAVEAESIRESVRLTLRELERAGVLVSREFVPRGGYLNPSLTQVVPFGDLEARKPSSPKHDRRGTGQYHALLLETCDRRLEISRLLPAGRSRRAQATTGARVQRDGPGGNSGGASECRAVPGTGPLSGSSGRW